MIKYYAGNIYYNKFQSDEKEYKNYKYWSIHYYNENNEYHREDGPAIEYSDGTKFWYKNDERHREDGPAIQFANGLKKYWYNGERINVSTDKEFKQYIKMRVFI
jgi:hypothetical protein